MYAEFYNLDGTLAHHETVENEERAIKLADGRKYRIAEHCPASTDHKSGAVLLTGDLRG